MDPKNVSRFMLRTIIMIIPMIVLFVIAVLCLVFTSIQQFINWTFGKVSYWDVPNEWHQIKEDAFTWYKIWLRGFGDF